MSDVLSVFLLLVSVCFGIAVLQVGFADSTLTNGAVTLLGSRNVFLETDWSRSKKGEKEKQVLGSGVSIKAVGFGQGPNTTWK